MTVVKKLALILTLSMAFASIYMIDVVFDPEHLTIEGTQIVHWMNPLSESTSQALFLLYPNLHKESNKEISPIQRDDHKGWIDISEVYVDGKKANFKISESFTEMFQDYSKGETLLVIDLGRNVSTNQEVEIEIHFRTKFPEKGEDEGCYGGACIWRFGWYPIEVYSKGGKYYDGMVYSPHTCYLRASAPKGWEVVKHDGSGMGCPIAFLKDYEKYDLEGKRYRVTVHYRKGLKGKAMEIASIALHTLDEYSKRFGDLDYSDVHIIESPYSRLFGMTASGMIILGDNAFTTSDLMLPGFTTPLLEFLLYHEIAHLWFGIGTEVDFSSDNFLSESLAQYAAITQVEAERGATDNLFENVPDMLTDSLKKLSAFRSLRENYLYIYREAFREGMDGPIEGKPEYLNQNLPLNYAKGYFAFRTLSLMFDDFDSFLKEYHTKFKNSVVTYEDFKELTLKKNPETKNALKLLFENPEPIDAKVKVTKDGVEVIIPKGISYQVEITRDGTKNVLTLRDSTTLTGVDEVHVDPNWLLPDPDRFNNHFPPMISVGPLDQTSPLESYRLDFAFAELDISASNLYLGAGLSASKFDEWAISASFGNVYTVDSSSATLESCGIYISTAYSPSPFILIGSNFFYDMSNIFASAQIGIAIPESLDIGYTSLYFYPRNLIYLGADYKNGNITGWGEYDFVDLVKSSIALGIYGDLDNSFNWTLASQLSYFPSKHFDISGFGVYSSLKSKGVIEGSAGVHFDLDSPWRENIFNFLSFRGIHMSLKVGGDDFIESNSYQFDSFFELSAILKAHIVLDQMIFMGVNLRYYTSGKIAYYFGVSFQDNVLTSAETAISALPTPPLRSRIRPSQP
jgi:hypothetical protein